MELFSRKYAVLESSTFDLKFVRLLLLESLPAELQQRFGE